MLSRFRNVIAASWAAGCCLALLCGIQCLGAGEETPFNRSHVSSIRLQIAPEHLEALRRAPRTWVPATFKEGTNVPRSVAVHLKGATGSFRSVDDKPGLTLRFDHYVPGQTWRGLSKVHLNNSVEDPSCMRELLGSELFRSAGIPAARAAHAVVTLNGRRLGPYVLKEGFTQTFLAEQFNDASGRLYEPAAGRDPGERMELKQGQASGQSRSDLVALEALASATCKRDMAQRWALLNMHLDVNRFATFMAMEVLLAHRDGYCLARNNFRIYQHSSTGRAVFLPHGMDQLFGRVPNSLAPRMVGRVAVSFLDAPQGRQAYQAELNRLARHLFAPAALSRRVDAEFAVLQDVLTAAEKAQVRAACDDLKRAIARRNADIVTLLEVDPAALVFTNGTATLLQWRRANDSTAAQMALLSGPSPDLHIQSGPRTAAAWTSVAVLDPGRYRFEGRIRTAGVKSLPFGRNHGAALSVAGPGQAKSPGILGTTNGVDLALDFQLSSRQQVTFACELRASAGEAWFSVPSLQLRRFGENRIP